MTAPKTATEARAAGFTRELFASSCTVDLELLVRPDVDLDGAFECFDLNESELLVVSGWLFESFEDRRVEDSTETRDALRQELKAFYNQLATFAAKLDTIDHAAARDVNEARSDLFAAWSKLRAAPPIA